MIRSFTASLADPTFMNWGVLSSLFVTLAVNESLKKMIGGALMLKAQAENTWNMANQTPRTINSWSLPAGLKADTDKTDLVLFTKKYKIPAWFKPELKEYTLQLKPSIWELRSTESCSGDLMRRNE